MKTADMEKICKQQNGKCGNCPLNCIKDWYENLTTWCMLEYRKETIHRYDKALIENNELLAAKIMKDYQEKEKLIKL